MPYGGMQLGLWGGMGEADERAGRVLARVQGMLGPDRVLTAVLGGGRDPGDQVRLVPWGDERMPDRPADPPWPGRLPAPSPATVLPAPVPAEVTDAGGRAGRGDRAVRRSPAAPARLARAPAGPRWRSPPGPARGRPTSAGGTRRPRASRARFQLVGTDGTAWLVTRDRTGWHLEATYD